MHPFSLSFFLALLFSIIFQSWAENMSKSNEPKIKNYGGEDFTKITFSPDLKKFKMESLDEDIVSLMSRRAYDIAAASRGVKVFLNGKRISVSILINISINYRTQYLLFVV